MVATYDIQAIAIGNGTAGRETEKFIQTLRFDRKVQVFVVSESGASVYSASKIAREEFPEYDVTVRGAVSIGRRLMDPLAELVKIDPKSIGVGQYQHDMNQKKLSETLGGVVEDSVNKVGVDLNTASASLLEYISGISKSVAKNIIDYRETNGRFTNRKQLLKVAKLGPKAFEQCAGFMRITGGDNPLDATSVHPESYEAAAKLFRQEMYSTHIDIYHAHFLSYISLLKQTAVTVACVVYKYFYVFFLEIVRKPLTLIKLHQIRGKYITPKPLMCSCKLIRKSCKPLSSSGNKNQVIAFFRKSFCKLLTYS